jgi:hypothetical protein
MISRRALLGTTASGLLMPGVASAIGFNGTTRPGTPSINWNHPACKNLAFSFIQGGGVATTGAVFDNVKKQKGAATGTTVGGVLPWMGNIVTLASTNHYNFTTRPLVVEQVATFWVVIQVTSLAACDLFFTSSAGNSGILLQMAASGALILGLGGVSSTTSTVLLSAAVPYLIIVSKSWAVSTFLSKRLDTNAVATQVTTSGTPTASTGTYLLGASSGANNVCAASFAAFSYANIFTPLSDMIKLAADPWGPWRGANPLPTEEMVAGAAAATGSGRLISVP